MTKPLATNQGPRITESGMVRERLMPADASNLCADPQNRFWFDLVIEAGYMKHRPQTPKLDRATRVAKAICHACPVRDACFMVHGPDLELGVVGGATDAERGHVFGGDAA